MDGFLRILGFTQIKNFIANLLGLQVSPFEPFEDLLDMVGDQAREQEDFISAITCYALVLEKKLYNVCALVGLSRS